MKQRPKFDETKATYADNPIYLSKLLDPYSLKISKVLYKLGFSANGMTLLTFILGLASIAVILLVRTRTGFILAGILILLRNIGDGADGKIARATNTATPMGGFTDLVTDWIVFHAAFFIAIGYVTGHVALGFLCVTGYMSREFTRGKFTHFYKKKITDTKEAKEVSWIVSVVRKYDLGNVFWIAPIIMMVTNPVIIIYAVAILEYGLLAGEIGFNYILFLKQK